MNVHAKNILKLIVLLIAALTAAFSNGSRVICHEPDGRIAIESAHAPGTCQRATQSSDQQSILDNAHATCIDLPLGDDNAQSLRRARDLTGDLHLAIPVALLAYQVPAPTPVASIVRPPIPANLSIIRTTILLV